MKKGTKRKEDQMTGRRKSYTKRGENDTAFQQGAKEVMEKKGKSLMI